MIYSILSFCDRTFWIVSFAVMFTLTSAQSVDCGGSYSGTTTGQAAPGTVCDPFSANFQNRYNKQSFYTPASNDPLIGVKVVFHMFMPSVQPSGAGILFKYTYNSLQFQRSCCHTSEFKERY